MEHFDTEQPSGKLYTYLLESNDYLENSGSNHHSQNIKIQEDNTSCSNDKFIDIRNHEYQNVYTGMSNS